MRATDRLVLPRDVVIAHASSLGPELRERLEATEDDRVITRPRARARSLVVDSGLAAFLELFRTPMTVVEAVLRHASATGEDPAALLEAAAPLLVRLRREQLVAIEGASSAAPIEPTFAPGTSAAGLEVLDCVHLFEDVEVYRARARDGDEVALKILRPAADERARVMLEREAVVLRHLAGPPAPHLLGQGEWNGRPFMVQSWCEGIGAARAAAARRAASQAPFAPEVLELCAEILRAYASLHARGVVHGDVHPGNVWVGPTGTVWLLDFGLARCERGAESLPPPRRGGIHEYLEPEYCAAQACGRAPPAATALSDQYSLGALLYRLLTGQPHLEFKLERSQWLQQVSRGGALPFAERGLPAWPELEDVLARALDAEPTRRFASTAELRAAFAGATAPRVARRREPDHGAELLESALLRFSPAASMGGEVASALLPPRCSVHYGAAGVAWFLYRVAGLRDDPRLLAAADGWCRWALRRAPEPGAFESAEIHITTETTGRISPFHRLSGVHLVHAHVCRAMGDLEGASRAARTFLDAVAVLGDDPDLTVGWASALLGCAALLEALPQVEAIDRGGLLARGGELARAVEARLAASPIVGATTPRWLGLAHGWAGLLFGLLRWTQASGTPFPAIARHRLAELATLAMRTGAQASWSLRLGDAPEDRRALTGWCHGSAGYLLLWTLAHRVLGGGDWLSLARGAAEHLAACRDAGEVGASLCCGSAGQGFAALALYRLTGEPSILRWAGQRRDHAVRFAAATTRPDSLYKGRLGVALLVEELGHPERSCMPLVEAEGWAPSNA